MKKNLAVEEENRLELKEEDLIMKITIHLETKVLTMFKKTPLKTTNPHQMKIKVLR